MCYPLGERKKSSPWYEETRPNNQVQDYFPSVVKDSIDGSFEFANRLNNAKSPKEYKMSQFLQTSPPLVIAISTISKPPDYSHPLFIWYLREIIKQTFTAKIFQTGGHVFESPGILCKKFYIPLSSSFLFYQKHTKQPLKKDGKQFSSLCTCLLKRGHSMDKDRTLANCVVCI